MFSFFKLMPKISCYTFLYFSPFISSARLFYNVIPLTCYYWSLFSSGISNMGHQHCKQRYLESSLYYITLYYTKVIHLNTQPVQTLFLFKSIWILPQGSQGCQKMRQDPLNMPFEVWCANIAPERHKLWKTVKIGKKCQKTPVFIDFFKYSSIWGQY